jgi:hypothetical protein
MSRRSDGLYTNGEKRLKCSKGDQKSDEGVLDRPAALPALFQATEVFKGQRLTIDGVRQAIAPDDWLFILYRSADAETVTHITAPLRFLLCVSDRPQPLGFRSHTSLCAESHLCPGMGA